MSKQKPEKGGSSSNGTESHVKGKFLIGITERP